MPDNPLLELARRGQSPWLDDLRREYFTAGTLQRLIDSDGLRGVTSNPTIFDRAISASTAYDADIRAAVADRLDAGQAFERLAIAEIQRACDLFRPLYEKTGGGDGFVSLEVSPDLANDTAGTLAEARRLWTAVGRPNALIKVPGTPAGLPAIRKLLAEGINVNITLLFSVANYRQLHAAYIEALSERDGLGLGLDNVASVASFFVSRVDTEVDRRLEEFIAKAKGAERERLESLRGKAAIANARVAYRDFLVVTKTAEWRQVAAKQARLQRPLWASTSSKNPAYRDVIYVEELIGENTVNTMPLATLDAFRDHGEVSESLLRDPEGSVATLRALAEAGIDMDDVTAKLQRDGVKSFKDSFDSLLAGVEKKMTALAAKGA
jgi:transaldolase